MYILLGPDSSVFVGVQCTVVLLKRTYPTPCSSTGYDSSTKSESSGGVCRGCPCKLQMLGVFSSYHATTVH